MARGRAIAAGVCVAVLGLAALGCGAQEHPNEPRPAPPTRVSVAVNRDSITVSPARIGIGPEKSQLIQQNRNHAQPPIKTKDPLDIVFTTANLTPKESKLEIHGPKNTTSGPLVANGNNAYQTALPTGTYTITAADLPGSKPATLTVGPYRASSQNDLLLP